MRSLVGDVIRGQHDPVEATRLLGVLKDHDLDHASAIE
jgi:hypothetical protein